MKKKTVRGEWSSLRYRVFLDDKEIYEAGNSPYDSQGFVSASEGVGEKTMEKFCIHTTEMMAEENGAIYGGVQGFDEEGEGAGD